MKWWFVVELLEPIHIIFHEIVPEAWTAAGSVVRKWTASFSAAVLGGYFSLLKSAWTPSIDQCRKLISCISWHKYVSSALTFCTTAPKGQSMPTHAWWQICKDWQAKGSCLRKLHFHKTVSLYVCVCRYIYLLICAGITFCGVNATCSISSAAPFTLRSEVGLTTLQLLCY